MALTISSSILKYLQRAIQLITSEFVQFGVITDTSASLEILIDGLIRVMEFKRKDEFFSRTTCWEICKKLSFVSWLTEPICIIDTVHESRRVPALFRYILNSKSFERFYQEFRNSYLIDEFYEFDCIFNPEDNHQIFLQQLSALTFIDFRLSIDPFESNPSKFSTIVGPAPRQKPLIYRTSEPTAPPTAPALLTPQPTLDIPQLAPHLATEPVALQSFPQPSLNPTFTSNASTAPAAPAEQGLLFRKPKTRASQGPKTPHNNPEPQIILQPTTTSKPFEFQRPQRVAAAEKPIEISKPLKIKEKKQIEPQKNSQHLPDTLQRNQTETNTSIEPPKPIPTQEDVHPPSNNDPLFVEPEPVVHPSSHTGEQQEIKAEEIQEVVHPSSHTGEQKEIKAEEIQDRPQPNIVDPEPSLSFVPTQVHTKKKKQKREKRRIATIEEWAGSPIPQDKKDEPTKKYI